jgi:competence ComEA-like helix-hairpin-helix protein
MAGEIDLNRASSEELATLPGIGRALAGRIVAYREQSGGFTAVDDLLGVSGVTSRLLDNIRERVVVGSGAGSYGGGGGGGEDGGERFEPGKHHGGDPVRIHEDYLRHHLEGGGPATPEAYEHARLQFARLPGAVQRPPTEVKAAEPPTEPASDEPAGDEEDEP